MVKAITTTILLLGCSISEAFTPSSSLSVKSKTSLDAHSIDTRKRLEGQGKFSLQLFALAHHVLSHTIVSCIWCTPSSNDIYLYKRYFVNRCTDNFV